jgi:hypothetical protein
MMTRRRIRCKKDSENQFPKLCKKQGKQGFLVSALSLRYERYFPVIFTAEMFLYRDAVEQFIVRSGVPGDHDHRRASWS